MATSSRPLFTIVTPTLNCGHLLPRNIASLQSQGLPPGELEHWVIDGGSRDGTLEVLRRHPDIRFISEKDRGLSDALNKGVQRATGEWIIWLNADDELAPEALPRFKAALTEYPDVRLFCGRQKVFRYDGTLECESEAIEYRLEDLLGLRTSIIQASTFAHRSVFEKIGVFEVECRYAMDYEWIVRAAHHFRCQALPVVLTHYHRRQGSIMDAHMADHYRTFLRVRRRYGLSHVAPGELRIRFYLGTEPLRRLRWLRGAVRGIKSVFGAAPAHPMS